MSKRDGATVYVNLGRIEAETSDHGQRLCGKSLIEFDQIDFVQSHSGELQRLWNRIDRADPHLLGQTTRRCEGNETGEWLDTQTLRSIGRHYYRRGSSIRRLRRIACCHRALGMENRLQFGQRL